MQAKTSTKITFMASDIIIQRDYYLNQLISMRHNHLVKIITGIRRSGKSFLLFNLFTEYLRRADVPDSHIIRIALDEPQNSHLCDPLQFLAYIDSQLKDEQMHYVLIDEVQLMDNFVGVLNSLLRKPNVDTYVTGSNSKLLSKDVVTEFRGRGYEIHIYPLSFAEYFHGLGGDRYERWEEYIRYGGLPQLLTFKTKKQKEDFLEQLQQTVYMRDLIERYKIKNVSEFQELLWIMASSIGAPCNPNKLSNTFKSVKNVTLSSSTIANYLTYMEDAFMLEKAMRYDIKGKKYINTLSKYYFQDIGIRNAAIGFRQVEESHIMENVIYNELRSRGYRVDVGIVEVWQTNGDKRQRKQLEVDFVAEQADKRYYIQSAYQMVTEEKINQETASLRNINDSFKRIIITRSNSGAYYDDNGFLHVGLFDFLLQPNILDKE